MVEGGNIRFNWARNRARKYYQTISLYQSIPV